MQDIYGIVEFPVSHEEFTVDVLGAHLDDKITKLVHFVDEHPNLRDTVVMMYSEWVMDNIDTIKEFGMLSTENCIEYINIIVGISAEYCIKISWPCATATEQRLYDLTVGTDNG